jgi:hypothetical protein
MTKTFSLTKHRYQMKRMSEIKTQILDELLDEISRLGCNIWTSSDTMTISKSSSYLYETKEVILSYEKDAVGYKSIRTSFVTAKKRVQLFLDRCILDGL